MKLSEDVSGNPKPGPKKYTREKLEEFEGYLQIYLIEYYKVGILQDMRGPACINVIEGERIIYTAREHVLDITGDPMKDAKAFAFELAGKPKKLEIDPVTFDNNKYEKIMAYVALYTWDDDCEKGYLRAGNISWNTLNNMRATSKKDL